MGIDETPSDNVASPIAAPPTMEFTREQEAFIDAIVSSKIEQLKGDPQAPAVRALAARQPLLTATEAEYAQAAATAALATWASPKLRWWALLPAAISLLDRGDGEESNEAQLRRAAIPAAIGALGIASTRFGRK